MKIEIFEHEKNNIACVSEDTVISTVQDATDLLGNADYQGASRIILKEANLNPSFFDLRSGMAGEVLQKISNYHKKLAIIGEFSKFESNALNAFISECNRGNHIYFVADMKTALSKLT